MPRVTFALAGIEPDDRLYRDDPAARRWFWREAAAVGIKVKRNSLVKGLGRDGGPLAPIHALTRRARQDDINPVTGRAPYSPMGRARPNAAPLMATGRRSRTYSLLRAEPKGEAVRFWWGDDPHTGRNWGEILKRHAEGFARHFRYPSNGWGFVKGRDVIGLSEADERAIRVEMGRRWDAYKRNRAIRPKAAPAFNRKEYLRPGIYQATDFTTGDVRDVQGRRAFAARAPDRTGPAPADPPDDAGRDPAADAARAAGRGRVGRRDPRGHRRRVAALPAGRADVARPVPHAGRSGVVAGGGPGGLAPRGMTPASARSLASSAQPSAPSGLAANSWRSTRIGLSLIVAS
jgi:hypothetical protein